jgi:hypothetical protein
MEEDKLISSIATVLTSFALALIPVIITYFNKRSKSNIHNSLLEKGQKKIEFLNNYYDSLSKILTSAEIAEFKPQLHNDFKKIKESVDLFDEEYNKEKQKHNFLDQLFLTFKPLSIWGWIWALLFYLFLIVESFVVLSLFLDEEGFLSVSAFQANMQEAGSGFGIFFIILTFLILLFFRWLALKNYKKNLAKLEDSTD